MRLQEALKSTLPILTTIKCKNLAPGPCSYKNITFYPTDEENIFEIQCLNIAAFEEKAFRDAIESQIKDSRIFFHKSTRRVSKSGDIISGGTIRFHMEDIAKNETISVKRIFNDLSSAEFQEHVRNFGLVLEQSQVRTLMKNIIVFGTIRKFILGCTRAELASTLDDDLDFVWVYFAFLDCCFHFRESLRFKT